MCSSFRCEAFCFFYSSTNKVTFLLLESRFNQFWISITGGRWWNYWGIRYFLLCSRRRKKEYVGDVIVESMPARCTVNFSWNTDLIISLSIYWTYLNPHTKLSSMFPGGRCGAGGVGTDEIDSVLNGYCSSGVASLFLLRKLLQDSMGGIWGCNRIWNTRTGIILPYHRKG